jgi:hypothetical protein
MPSGAFALLMCTAYDTQYQRHFSTATPDNLVLKNQYTNAILQKNTACNRSMNTLA